MGLYRGSNSLILPGVWDVYCSQVDDTKPKSCSQRILCSGDYNMSGVIPLAVTMGYRSCKNPHNKASLRTGTGRGNDPKYA